MTEFDVVPFDVSQRTHRVQFYRVNFEWISRLSMWEAEDERAVTQPDDILLHGGRIWLAFLRHNADVCIGSVGWHAQTFDEHVARFVCDNDGARVQRASALPCFEMFKYGVSPSYHGKGVGKALLQVAMQWALNESGAGLLLLFSAEKLTSALTLYERVGFRRVVITNSPFEDADVEMAMVLNSSG